MNNKLHIKKGDNVVVISGADKGKKGKVIVEGVNMLTKHTKPRRQGETGGIIHQEGAIYACKVMHICDKCGQPTRAGYKMLNDGGKSRVCKKCSEVLDD